MKQIRLTGCQSWEDSTIDLSFDRINIITAPNNVGKSVLFKMLKISVCPGIYSPRKRKKLIRWGYDCARALYSFEDGGLGGVVVYPTRVIYLYRPKGVTQWLKAYEPDPRMVKGLGLLVNQEKTFIANIIDTDQNLLLVDSDAKSTYEFINMLCNHASLDEYLWKLEEIQKEISSSRNRLEDRIQILYKQIAHAEFADVDTLEHKIGRNACAKNVIFQSITIATTLDTLTDSLKHARDYDKLESLINITLAIEGICFERCLERQFHSELEQYCELLCKLNDIELMCIMEHTPPSDETILILLEELECIQLERIQEVKKCVSIKTVDSLEVLEEIQSEILTLEQSIKAANVAAKETEKLEAEFKNSGKVYECPIYGEVIFDGKECVSYHN